MDLNREVQTLKALQSPPNTPLGQGACYALCYSSKRLVLIWNIVPYELELEYQSSASFPKICTVSL